MSALSRIYSERQFQDVVTIRDKRDFPLAPKSDILYFFDGQVDMEDKPINVPSGGLFMAGHGAELSGVYSSSDNYTLFVGATAGNLFYHDMFVDVTGTGSKVYDLTSATGNEAVEIERVNFNGCTSLGDLYNYRQVLELNTGRFGDTPELTLHGSMDGYRASTTIVRGLDSGFTGSLFKAGTDLSFSNRFLTDMNCDLPSGASVADFTIENFEAPSLMQVQGGIFSRNGVVSTGDNQFFPSLDPEDLVCSWKNNEGLRNTREGGSLTVTAEVTTTVSLASTYYDLAGTWTADRLQHFSANVNGQLQNDGTNPVEYRVDADLVIRGTANDSLNVKIVRWNDADQVFEDLRVMPATINSLSGPRDVAIVNMRWTATIEQNDYIKIQVSNVTGARDVTAEVGSAFEASI